MTSSNDNAIDLDVFFQDAKETQKPLSDRLMANILADAADVAARRNPASIPVAAKVGGKPGWLRKFLDPFGGIQGVAAVGFCTVIGVAAGYAGTEQLQSVPGVSSFITSSNTSDLLSDFSYDSIAGYSDFLAEG